MTSRLPTSPSFQGINFKINTPMLKTTSFSGKTRRVAMGHQFYTFTVKYPQLTPAELGYVQSFLIARLGGYDAFEVVLPTLSYSKAPLTPSGTPTVTTTVTTGSTSVEVTNIGPNRMVLKGGDFFKFANHSKVYIATADVESDSGGSATLNFGGALVQHVPSGTTATFTVVPFTVILDGDDQGYDVGLGGMTSLSLDLREVW